MGPLERGGGEVSALHEPDAGHHEPPGGGRGPPARGSAYADVRVVDARTRNLSTKNGKVGSVSESESLGLGVRVLAEGAWGFASTDQLTREQIDSTAARAVAIARASARVKKKDIALAPEQKITAVWQTPIEKDPFGVSLEEMLKLLFRAKPRRGLLD